MAVAISVYGVDSGAALAVRPHTCCMYYMYLCMYACTICMCVCTCVYVLNENPLSHIVLSVCVLTVRILMISTFLYTSTELCMPMYMCMYTTSMI